MKKELSKQLLLSGMGCYLCTGIGVLVNILLLPYARAYHGYGAAGLLLCTALSLAALLLAARFLSVWR